MHKAQFRLLFKAIMGTMNVQRYTPITVTQTAPFQTINLTIDLVVSMELIKQVAF